MHLLYDLHSCAFHEVLLQCLFVLVELINGYVKDLSAVSPSRDRKCKYFQFTLQTKDEERRVASFSLEKHKHLSKIQTKNTNCELRK